jgi:RNA polymerase sigma-70 factor (ECF subfamily)
MSEGWSWVREGDQPFPEPNGDAFLSPDRREAVLPVRLEPGRSYVIWLNSRQYRFFRDAAGNELAPVRWAFSTAP